jgi:hypothetical protein
VIHIGRVYIVSCDGPRRVVALAEGALPATHPRALDVECSDGAAARAHECVIHVARIDVPSRDRVRRVDALRERPLAAACARALDVELLDFAVGSAQEPVIHIARINVDSGDPTRRVDARGVGALQVARPPAFDIELGDFAVGSTQEAMGVAVRVDVGCRDHAHRVEVINGSYAPAVSTTIRVEQGDLNGAYDQAMEFLRRRPDVSIAHYSMSYVLRYAGLLDEASKECDNALAIDPGFNVFRSCATPFILSGDYPHALRFIHLDENSGATAMLRTVIALRTKNTAAVFAESDVAAKTGLHFTDLARSCLSHAPEEEIRRTAAQIESDPRLSLDAEEVYRSAEFLGFCGFGDAALRQLRKAIGGNYCSYPALDRDPLFNPIRQRAEFAELRQAGLKCLESFQNHRRQATAGPSVPSQKFN